MQRYEYRVIPAPKKGKKSKGVRGTEARFANALTDLMNEMAEDGWEYQRTDTLPSEERSGLAGKTTVFQNMLVFRRDLTAEAAVTGATDAEFTPSISLDEVADLHAPKLPSATEANVARNDVEGPTTGDDTRGDKSAHAAE